MVPLDTTAKLRAAITLGLDIEFTSYRPDTYDMPRSHEADSGGWIPCVVDEVDILAFQRHKHFRYRAFMPEPAK